ncbi:extracellular solute-binding protein [Geobacillus thermoleovorans]|uniref:ABC transporter substrate-binding protein n=1 Tax=Geobacillus thermoleovorans TaxID=33941 RepID=UPI00104785FE
MVYKTVLQLLLLLCLVACSQGDMTLIKGKGDSREKIHLEFFSPKPETVAIFDELITKFERENPQVDIEQVVVPDGMAVLKTRIARGDVPDIFITYPIEQDYVLRAKKGYLMDLTHEPFIKSIEPTIQRRFLVDGKMYGMALTQNAVGVLYNKDIFKEMNLTIPKTWNEFIQVLEALKHSGKTPILMPNKDPAQTSVFNLNLIANEFESDYWEKVNKGKAKIYGDEKWINVCKKMLRVVSYAQRESFNEGYYETNENFAKGKGAMYIMGTWVLPEIERINPNLRYGIFPFPATNDPKMNRVLGGVDIGIAISAATKHPQVAKKFLEFLVKKENAQKLVNFEGSISAIKGVQTNKKVVKPLEILIQKGKSVNWPNHYWVGGSWAESDFRNYSFQFFYDKDIGVYLRNLDNMFEYYRAQNPNFR